jgi:hypothetical protein
MKNLEFKEIEDSVKKQSSKRKEEESLWNLFLQHAPYQSLNGLWVLMNVLLVIGILISWMIDSNLLSPLILLAILGNGIFYENIERWNTMRLEKSLVEKFNSDPQLFDNMIRDLKLVHATYTTKKQEQEKKIYTNGLLEWDERDYYEKELIPHWDRMIWSIESDIKWCKVQRIDAMRRRDEIRQVVIIQSNYAPHNDLV